MSEITITDYLLRHARLQPEKCALICVDKTQTSGWNYAALLEQVLNVAAAIAPYAQAGDRALILLDSGIDYVASFLACQYLGVIAVPSFPPESAKPQHVARVQAIIADARACLVLTHSRMLPAMAQLIAASDATQLLAVDACQPRQYAVARHPARHDELAFLQYTSGSTGTPKGVMVSHGNLIANEQVITERMATGPDDLMVSWLPLFHDMGLIGGLLQPIFVGYPLVLCSPRYFMEKPMRWLELVSQYRATVSGGPDFAFRLCVERFKPQQEALDLSSWRVAFSGAEPIRPETLQQFAKSCEPAGFAPQALYPCYGLAEATLMVSGVNAGQGVLATAFATDALASGRIVPAVATQAHTILVSCGYLSAHHQVRISCPKTGEALAPDQVGEIWCHGPSIALGYWQNAKASTATFVDVDQQRYLRTGDLGFVWQQQLYITGRCKDLIIIDGHNFYPQDIEQLIEAEFDWVRAGRVAAFAVPNSQGGEGIGLAVEINKSKLLHRSLIDVAVSLYKAVAAALSHAPQFVALLLPGKLPKTSSGKLQRGACLRLWQTGDLEVEAAFSHTELLAAQISMGAVAGQLPQQWSQDKQILATLWQQVLGVPLVSDHANFFDLGGTSRLAAQLTGLISEQFAKSLAPTALFTQPEFGRFYQLLHDAEAVSGIAWPSLALMDYPLSAQQLRLLFLRQLSPSSSAYHLARCSEFIGLLDIECWQQACAAVLQQHSILRTRYFCQTDGQWRQQVSEVALAWQYVRCVGEQPAVLPSDWQLLQAQMPFDLEQGQNIRFVLVETHPNHFQFLLVMHHIAGDAHSAELILRDIVQHYQCLQSTGQPKPFAAAHNYGDYAMWQQQWLATPQASQQLQYWLSVLKPGVDPTLLASDRTTLTPQTHQLAVRVVNVLPASDVQRLEQLARTQHCTLFTLLLASLQVLFFRFSNKAHSRIGVPLAARPTPQLQRLSGLLVNTVVIDNLVDANQRFIELLTQVQQHTLAAQLAQDYPFEKIVEALNPTRAAGSNPLFQVMFNHLEQAQDCWVDLVAVDCVAEHSLPVQPQFDLSLDSVLQRDHSLKLEWQYNPALFSQALIERLHGTLLHLLAQISEQPQAKLGDLSLTAAAPQLLALGCGRALAATARSWQWSTQLRRHAALQSAKTAIIYQDQAYSYAWLDQQANRLAQALLAQAIQSGDVVALCLPRTPLLLVAVVACLRAGLTYLPLDQQAPIAQLEYIIEHSASRLLLVHQPLALQSAVVQRCPQQLIDAYPATTAAPVSVVQPEQIAYLNYTSGSTGQSKGVAVSYGALSGYIASTQDFIGISETDVVLQFATASFDAFVEQVLPTLAVGATLLMRGDALWDATQLYQQAQRHAVSVMDLTAAYWRLLVAGWYQLAQQHPLHLPALRQVHSGGEAMSVQALQQWQQLGLSHTKLLNTYGPTEAVVEATAFVCDSAPGTSIPLGSALPGRHLYVLDQHYALTSDGQVGELFIGGELLAQSYWQNPSLTASRFVADPFRADGSRMYATGDLVYWQDAQLCYVGRCDHQVKIRGFRVELADIEAALLRLDGIQQAVVLKKDQPEGAILVGFVSVSAPQQAGLIERLRQQLANDLPAYMVPSVLVCLQELPLNGNGKLDRQRVAALPFNLPGDATPGAKIAAQTPLEKRLCQLWSSVLQRDIEDVQSSFFDLGAHSLSLMQVHQQLQRQYPDLQLVDLFTYPSIRSLASFMAQQGLQQTNAQPALAASAAQQQKQAMRALAAKRKPTRELL